MSKQRNARFWVYWNGGYVKLTLCPDQDLTAWAGGPTEEGFSQTLITWTYESEDSMIVQNGVTYGRDCDGRHEHTWELECRVEALKANWHAGLQVPDWTKVRTGQRDYAAEAAGY